MLDTQEFGSLLKERNYDFYSGVPCSFLKNLINYAINECDYVMASNEGDAVAHCAGAFLGGRKTVFLCQNSGLTNATSPLTSLNYPFKIPVLGFVSLRGESGLNDEPQHELMGQITEKLLETMEIPWAYLSSNLDEARQQLDSAEETLGKGLPFFFVVKKSTFDKCQLKPQTRTRPVNSEKKKDPRLSTCSERWKLLSQLVSCGNEKTAYIATTGHTGRELFAVNDLDNNLYMVGSMGCSSSISLGLALAREDLDVVCLDGDGAALMRLGTFASAAAYAPRNMLHILFDNGAHLSTGGQATVSTNVDFVEVAASVGYEKSFYCDSDEEFEDLIAQWQKEKGLTFIYCRVPATPMPDLPRPSISPENVTKRFMNHFESKLN